MIIRCADPIERDRRVAGTTVRGDENIRRLPVPGAPRIGARAGEVVVGDIDVAGRTGANPRLVEIVCRIEGIDRRAEIAAAGRPGVGVDLGINGAHGDERCGERRRSVRAPGEGFVDVIQLAIIEPRRPPVRGLEVRVG